MPMLVVSIMSQLVFSGGMIPVYHRIGLEQLVLGHARALGLRGVGVVDRLSASWYQVKQIPKRPALAALKHILLFDLAMLAVCCADL